jgi:acyl dehydratase
MISSPPIELGEKLYAAMRGKTYESFDVIAMAEDISAYARSTEDFNPIRYDPEAARAAGYADIVAQPTYLLSLAAKRGHSSLALGAFGFTPDHTLYGQQDFECYRPVCAGDRLKCEQRIAEVMEKKNGTRLFVITEMLWSDPEGAPVALTRQTLIVPLRDREKAA